MDFFKCSYLGMVKIIKYIKSNPKNPSACKYLGQNDRWIKNFYWEQWRQDLRCRQVMGAKTVENDKNLQKNQICDI